MMQIKTSFYIVKKISPKNPKFSIGLQDLSEWASPSKTLLLLPPQIPHVQPLALLAQPTPRAQDSRAAKREVGTSMTSWWQAGEATQVVGA